MKEGMVFKQPRQDLDLCGCSLSRYSEKCFTLFRELCIETPFWCSLEGNVSETSVTEFFHPKKKIIITLELQHNTSSRARTV